MAQLCWRRDSGESGANSIDHFDHRHVGHNSDYREGHNSDYNEGHYADYREDHNADYHEGHENYIAYESKLKSRENGGMDYRSNNCNQVHNVMGVYQPHYLAFLLAS